LKYLNYIVCLNLTYFFNFNFLKILSLHIEPFIRIRFFIEKIVHYHVKGLNLIFFFFYHLKDGLDHFQGDDLYLEDLVTNIRVIKMS